MDRRDFTQWLGMGALSIVLPSCYVQAQARPAATRIDYQPMLYNGYVVYYEGDGVPVYYVDGVIYYVPNNHPRYHVYVGHYNRHRAQYRRWNRVNPAPRTRDKRRPSRRSR